MEEDEGAIGVEALELVEERRRGALRAADDVDLGCVGVLGELFQGAHSGSARPADEEGDDAGRFGHETGVGGAHMFDVDHFGGWGVGSFWLRVFRIIGRYLVWAKADRKDTGIQ